MEGNEKFINSKISERYAKLTEDDLLVLKKIGINHVLYPSSCDSDSSYGLAYCNGQLSKNINSSLFCPLLQCELDFWSNSFQILK